MLKSMCHLVVCISRPEMSYTSASLVQPVCLYYIPIEVNNIVPIVKTTGAAQRWRCWLLRRATWSYSHNILKPAYQPRSFAAPDLRVRMSTAIVHWT
jgi:hypothetical protein